MPVRQLLCGWLDRRLVNQGRMSPIRGTANLALEMLEDRAVPAVVYNLANTQARPTDYSTKSIFVTFAPNTKPDLRLGAYAPGLQVGKGYNLVPGLYEAKVASGSVTNVLKALQTNKSVISAEANGIIRPTAIPNDPAFPMLYGMNNTGQTGGTPNADINAPEAWNTLTGTGGTVVAVLDTGVDYNHPDLRDNMWVNSGEIAGNGLDDDKNGYVDDIYGYDFANNDSNPMDDDGHGTHCAGTIAAVGNNGIGVAGVNWNAKIMALKFLGTNGGTTSDAIRALDYAVMMGVKLSNNSWGGGPASQALSVAIDRAAKANHIFIAAAGNSFNNNDVNPSFPASYLQDNIVSVAAIDHNGAIADFSNRGTFSVDIGAPGVDILSCQPGGGYQFLSGTSMAAPHVAGAMSLLLDRYPNITYSDAISMLYSSATIRPNLQAVVGGGGRYLNVGALIDAVPPSTYTGSPASSMPISVTSPVTTAAWVAPAPSVSVPNPRAIADGGSSNFTLNYPNSAIIANINVKVSISHPFVSDLDIRLVSPKGTIIPLFNRRGGSADNLTNTTFSDLAPVSIATGAAPFFGTYKPEGLLAALRGSNASGTWRLVVADRVRLDAGSVLSWSIDVTARTLPAIVVRSTTPQTLVAGGTISSAINVTRAISINDINVSLGLNVAQSGDISITLRGPQGQSIVLFNGTATVNSNMRVGFDDQASRDIPLVAATGQQVLQQSQLLPGTYKPANALSRFNTLTPVAAGAWTLEITDTRTAGTGPATILTDWSMSIIGLAG